MDQQLVSSARKPAENQHLTIKEAEELAASVITDTESALDEAIHMLTEIAHGRSYGTFEYMAKVLRMRQFSVAKGGR
jgi:hypothetical protein